MASVQPTKPGYDPAQLRKDRMTLVVMVVIFAAIVGLVVWLASMGALPENGNHWMPLMP